MVRLAAPTEPRLLELDEVTDMGLDVKARAGTPEPLQMPAGQLLELVT